MKIKTAIDTTPEHLNRLMLRLKLHPNDVAELAGVHRVTVYKWLAGVHAVPISVIRILEMQRKGKK